MARGSVAVMPRPLYYGSVPVLWPAGSGLGLPPHWRAAAGDVWLAAIVAGGEVGCQDVVTYFIIALRAYIVPPPALA